MEINGSIVFMPIGKRFQPAAGVVERDRRGCADVATPDRVVLSNHYRDVSRFNDLVGSVSDVRELRVEELRFSIESGAYDVSAEQIAEKIMGGDLLDELVQRLGNR